MKLIIPSQPTDVKHGIVYGFAGALHIAEPSASLAHGGDHSVLLEFHNKPLFDAAVRWLNQHAITYQVELD